MCVYSFRAARILHFWPIERDFGSAGAATTLPKREKKLPLVLSAQQIEEYSRAAAVAKQRRAGMDAVPDVRSWSFFTAGSALE